MFLNVNFLLIIGIFYVINVTNHILRKGDYMLKRWIPLLLVLCFIASFAAPALADDPVDEYDSVDIVFPFTKTWDDNNNADGKRPSSITVKLFRYEEGGSYDPSGTPFKTITVNGSATADTWTGQFVIPNDSTGGGADDLFYVDSEGNYHPYLLAIEEVPIPEYSMVASKNPSVTWSVNGGYVVNEPNNHRDWPVTIEGGTMSFVITKNTGTMPTRFTIWTPVKLSALEQAVLKHGIHELHIKANIDPEACAPDDVNFLYGTGSEASAAGIRVDSTTYPDGPHIIFDATSKWAMYAVGSFNRSVEGDYECSITNQYVPKTTIDIDVTKSWVNDTPSDRPESVRVYLVVNGARQDAYIDLNATGEWKGQFSNLPETDPEGTAISYDVEEDPVPTGYTSSKSGDAASGFTITNKFTPPETINIEVEKNWFGDTTADRPGSVEVQLLANKDPIQVLILKSDGNWKGVFPNLPKTDAEGLDINYDIEEVEVEGYTTAISGDASSGFTITNTKTPPPEPGTITIQLTKVWDDDDDKEGKRPESVTVALYADGKATGKTISLSERTDWQGKFEDLDATTPEGKEINYTVKENTVSGYTTEVSGDATTGFTITNIIRDTPPPPPVPKTGDTNHIGLYISTIVLSLLGCAALIQVLKKRRDM